MEPAGCWALITTTSRTGHTPSKQARLLGAESAHEQVLLTHGLFCFCRSYKHTGCAGYRLRATEILCNLLFVASTDLCLTPRRDPGTHGQHVHGSSSLHRIPAGQKHIPVRANMRPGVQTAPCHSDTKSCGCLPPFRATRPRHSDLGIIFPATSKEEGGPSVRCSPPSMPLRCP